VPSPRAQARAFDWRTGWTADHEHYTYRLDREGVTLRVLLTKPPFEVTYDDGCRTRFVRLEAAQIAYIDHLHHHAERAGADAQAD
jgi:hypothetical protein